MRKRQTFSGQFKPQIVLEVLTGVKRAARVCREHDIKQTVRDHFNDFSAKGLAG